MITDRDIRSLAEVRSDTAPIVSCYLDVDGARFVRHEDVGRMLDAQLKRVRAERDGGGRSAAVHDADLDRVSAYVGNGFDRKGVRGLAIFACGAVDLWTVIPLPVKVRTEVTCNPTPAVGQLEAVVHRAEPIGVLLVDKQRTRAFVFSLGELIEHTEVLDELPRDYDSTGEHDRGSVDRHRDALEQQHVRNAAHIALKLLQERPYAHLVVGAPDQVLSELEGALHPYVSERFRMRIDVPPAASIATIRERVLDAELAIERDREAELVTGLRDAVASGNRAVAGLDDVLAALAQHRVDRLLVSDGYSVGGWECLSCGRLAAVGPKCVCESKMTAVDDVVAEAVEATLAQSGFVDVCVGNADLDVLGRVGAMLRF